LKAGFLPAQLCRKTLKEVENAHQRGQKGKEIIIGIIIFKFEAKNFKQCKLLSLYRV
jgi:hypothetical protein